VQQPFIHAPLRNLSALLHAPCSMDGASSHEARVTFACTTTDARIPTDSAYSHTITHVITQVCDGVPSLSVQGMPEVKPPRSGTRYATNIRAGRVPIRIPQAVFWPSIVRRRPEWRPCPPHFDGTRVWFPLHGTGTHLRLKPLDCVEIF